MSSGSWLLVVFLLFSVFSLSWFPIAAIDYKASQIILSYKQPLALKSDSKIHTLMPDVQFAAVHPLMSKWSLPVIDLLSNNSFETRFWSINHQGVRVSNVISTATDDELSALWKAPDRLQVGGQNVNAAIWGGVYTIDDSQEAINSGMYLYQPWWSLLLVLSMALVYWLLLAFFSARTSLGRVWSFALILPVIYSSITVFLAIQYGQWIPVTPLLLSAFALIPYFLQRHKLFSKIRSYSTRFDAIQSELFQHYIDSEQFDVMYRKLNNHGFSKQHYEQVYELGLSFERKRSFDKAQKVYTLLNRVGGFKDSKPRLDHLKKVTNQSTDLPNLQETLVLDSDTFELPQLGRYHIIRELGRGSMGVVYLAKDPKIDRDIALKTIRLTDLEAHEIESVKKRFFKEAQAAGRLNHPNIVTVYDVGEEKDIAYIAMDFVKGEPMNHYAKPENLLEYTELLDIFGRVAEALKFAHDNDIVHRDIKPSNILYDRKTNTVKVSDFGIARIADSKQTQTGIVMGSPSFMSPEQIRGEKLTGKSDIFSLGVSLYQLLSGELPFKGENLPGLAYAITHAKQKSVKEFNTSLPQSVTRIVNKALQKDSVNRFADAGVMAETIYKVTKKVPRGTMKQEQ